MDKVLKKVRCVDNAQYEKSLTKGKVYEVVNIDDTFYPAWYTVMGDNNKYTGGYAYRFEEIKKNETKETIKGDWTTIINRKTIKYDYVTGKNKTTVILEYNGKNYTFTSRCHPDDTFDINVGIRVALDKIEEMIKEDMEKDTVVNPRVCSEKELEDRYKDIGDCKTVKGCSINQTFNGIKILLNNKDYNKGFGVIYVESDNEGESVEFCTYEELPYFIEWLQEVKKLYDDVKNMKTYATFQQALQHMKNGKNAMFNGTVYYINKNNKLIMDCTEACIESSFTLEMIESELWELL